MICQHCKKNFSDIYKLQRHQKTAKFCLSLQKEVKESKTCSGCNKEFFSERELSAHSCRVILSQNTEIINLLKEEIEKLKIRVKQLEDEKKIYEVSKKSKLEVLLPLTEDAIKSSVDKLSLEDILKGAYGFAMFAVKHIFKDRLFCSDISRQKVLYKDDKNEIKTDINMLFLRTSFFSSIKDRTGEILKNYRLSIDEKIDKICWSDSEEEEEFHLITAGVLDLKKIVSNASIGVENDFALDFVKYVCAEIIRIQ